MGVIAEQRHDVQRLEFFADGGDFDARFFIHLAGQTPIRREIHQHGFASGARLGDVFGAPRLPVNAVRRFL